MGRVTTRGLRLAGTSLLASAVVLLLAGAESCLNRLTGPILDQLRELLARPEWGDIEVGKTAGIRVHFYPELPSALLHGDVLPEGTVVEPFSPVEGTQRKLICGSQRGCLLIYVDTDPWAHYAHPVVIALWELDSSTFQRPVVAEWWPLVDGVPVLDTVEARDRVDFRWLGDPIRPADPTLAWGSARWTSGIRGTPILRRTPGLGPGGLRPTPAPQPGSCPVWAVLVNGYHDLADTFDEDTEGMRAVLTGLGVPEDQVYYLSPHHGNDPCPPLVTTFFCPTKSSDATCPTPSPGATCLPADTDYTQRTSHCNLKHLLTEVLPRRIAAAGTPCEELLFFMSSHGSKDSLYCGPQTVCAQDLQGWLSGVKCSKLTVIVEACRSGSLINDLVPTPAAFQQTRRIFTSTDQDGTSYMDVDWVQSPGIACGSASWVRDPNPGDSGSETIWGYIEAFGAGIADGAPQDARVSFAEAVDYALTNDVMKLNCLNDPQVVPTPTPNAIPHSCAAAAQAPDLAIKITAQAPGVSAIAGQVIRCQPAKLVLKVNNATANPASGPVAAATVKVYWAKGPQPTWPDDFCNRQPGKYLDHQIGETLLVTDLSPGDVWTHTLEWSVAPSFTAGDQLVLVATVDSPQDPIPVSPAATAQSSSQLFGWTNNAASTAVVVANPPSTSVCPAGCASMR